jgi:hypothetical protein
MDKQQRLSAHFQSLVCPALVVGCVIYEYFFRITMDEHPTSYIPFTVIGLIYSIIAVLSYNVLYNRVNLGLSVIGQMCVCYTWYQSLRLFMSCFEQESGHYPLICGKEFMVIGMEGGYLGFMMTLSAIMTSLSVYRLASLDPVLLQKKKKKQQ